MADVTEFIIVPPLPARQRMAAFKDAFSRFLSQKFKGYAFRVATIGPADGSENYVVLPVMNFIDDEGKERMCEQPQRWLLAEILGACAEFEASARPH